MTNEIKLLTALCDALGFEVEEIHTIEGIRASEFISLPMPEQNRISNMGGGRLEKGIDYKLTKKNESAVLQKAFFNDPATQKVMDKYAESFKKEMDEEVMEHFKKNAKD